MHEPEGMTDVGRAVERASIVVYEWRRRHYSAHQKVRDKREIAALVTVVEAVRAAFTHQWGNRVDSHGPGGLGAQCVKCGVQLEHDFDPATDRGHPTGMSCRTCGATEWQYVDGVLCLIPEQTLCTPERASVKASE